jgi:glycerophosphoryl diester phosphodiesterase
MASFAAAVAAGVHMIELDASISADGVVVVIHDDTLDRTTSSKGLVWEHDANELFGLDAGTWFSPDFAGQKIPALFDVFERFLPQVLINVEIKPLAAMVEGPFEPLFSQVAGMIRYFNAHDRVLVSCFDDLVLGRVRQQDPDIALAVLDDKPATLDCALARVEAVGASSYNPRALFTSKSLVCGLHEKGIKVLAWEKAKSQNQRSIASAIKKGVDGFFADDIGLLSSMTNKTGGRGFP